ncbi:MAG: hypothetical protein WC393_00060 [Candidatus Nanoarchaeia archaeon]|jgi:hypothetical protein
MGNAVLNTNEEVITFFGTDPKTPNVESVFETENKKERASADNDQIILLAEILKLFAGDNISKKAKDIFDKNNISLENKGGLTKFMDNLKESWKKTTESLEKIKKWFKDHKKHIAIGVGVVGLGVAAYFLLPFLL